MSFFSPSLVGSSLTFIWVLPVCLPGSRCTFVLPLFSISGKPNHDKAEGTAVSSRPVPLKCKNSIFFYFLFLQFEHSFTFNETNNPCRKSWRTIWVLCYFSRDKIPDFSKVPTSHWLQTVRRVLGTFWTLGFLPFPLLFPNQSDIEETMRIGDYINEANNVLFLLT